MVIIVPTRSGSGQHESGGTKRAGASRRSTGPDICYRATHGNSPVFAGSSCHLGRGGRSISAGSSGSSSAVWGLVAAAVGAGVVPGPGRELAR